MEPHSPVPGLEAEPAPRVIGLVQCRNEWGLIALAISHALIHHVDEVFVLNDGSTDQTHHGLEHLKEIWPGRITTINVSDSRFLQEASRNALAYLCQDARPDWLYFFDADEFLMTESGRGLKSLLHPLPADVVAVRYELLNFVSPRELDESALEDYRKIRYRADPRPDLDLSLEEMAEEILSFRLSYFDCPFYSKVIVRNSEAIRLAAGTHHLTYYGSSAPEIAIDELTAAHLSWLTRERLVRKAAQGYRHIANGRRAKYGWQNQMLYRAQSAGLLEELWERHSITDEMEGSGELPKSYVRDESFSDDIAAAIDVLTKGFGGSDISRRDGVEIPRAIAEETQVPVQVVIDVTQRLFGHVDFLDKKLNRPGPWARVKHHLRVKR